MVEFAIVLPVLLILVTGIIQFGLLFNKYISLTDSVRAGSRALALGRGLSNPCDPGVLQALQAGSAIGLTAAQVTLTAAQPFTLSVFGMTIVQLNLTASASNAVE